MATVDEIAPDIYRLSTSVPPTVVPGGFTFNQFLVVDEQPLLFHTGMRSLFPDVREAVARVIDPAQLRWVAFSHIEADECGALNDWLAVAPQAQALCSRVAVMTSGDMADRPPRALGDGEELALGPRKRLRWLDARTCRTTGNAATCSRRRPRRCWRAISSPTAGRISPRSRSRRCSVRPRRRGGPCRPAWRSIRARRGSWPSWPPPSRARWR